MTIRRILLVFAGAALQACFVAADTQERVTHVVPAMLRNSVLTWEWQPQYRVAPMLEGRGTVSGLPDEWVDEGWITLEAIPDPHHRFDGWSGPTNTTRNPLELHVDRPLTNLVASFSPLLTARGTPHAWLARHALEPEDDEDDSDGDGFANWQEYIADTCPTNPLSFFPPLGLEPSKGDQYFVMDPTSPDRMYAIIRADTILDSTWVVVTNAPGTGGPWRVQVPVPTETPTFYRGRVTLP